METIQDWINKDKTLSNLLVEIQNMTDKSTFQQAEFAFHKLCELYDLPKMPEDLLRFQRYHEENNIDEPRSVYEEFALIKFLEPNDDPRGIVLAAVFNIKNNIGVDLHEIIKESPEKPKIGIRGEGISSEVIFISDNESWVDLNCKVLLKPL